MKKFFTFFFFVAFAFSCMAQRGLNNWAITISTNFVDYVTSNPKDKLFSDINGWWGPSMLTVTRKINPSFNVASSFALNKIFYCPSPVMHRDYYGFDLGLRYKFANGYILKADHWFDPYIGVNGGINRFNSETSPVINAGIGFNLWLGEAAALNFQSYYDYVFDQDPNFHHSIGLVIGFGGGKKDRDHDGVADDVDKCPDIKGEKSNNGCPVISVTDETAINEIAKNIYFETDSDKLMPESVKKLDQLVEILNRHKGAKLLIEGHTDNTGDDNYNLQLSQKRADAVKAYLKGKGIPEKDMTAIGYGETRPAATNDSPDGRQLNRRVELKLSY